MNTPHEPSTEAAHEAVSGQSCSNCIFMQESSSPNPHVGECHYNPPVVVMWERNFYSSWPKVNRRDWCGKYNEGTEK